mmetsp:Transcript_24311/g.72639  ORF Transcript_24311/g.72639 Transcript_24311/m.72639 type:complete len:1418 (-) Transcript_24311:1276-5529(-)
MMAAGKPSFVLAALVAAASADVYLHSPRGSNNRLDEARRDRNNANRLFDSQNNNRGGSNVGSLYFYEGEKVPFEWTNQHGCGNTANDCQIIVQYMCDDNLRDGVTTRTIPNTPAQCLNNDCNSDTRYGMHEDYDYYQNCNYRFRNRGLFTADRNLQGNTAKYTRQNNNGQRRGYECPEERDYYPYWGPSPWIDMAIQTNTPEKCAWYQEESENVKGRYFCSLPDSWYHHMISRGGNGRNGFIPNTELGCAQLNRATSAMMTFLTSQESAYVQQMTASLQAEYMRCTAQMSNFAVLCTQGNASQCPQAVSFFNDAANFITEAQLNTQCPVCAAGSVPHPYATCHMCGEARCGLATAFANMTQVNETWVCPSGFVADEFSEWCISSNCSSAFTLLTTVEQRAIDTCKMDAVGTKVLVSGTNVDNFACLERNVTLASCLASGSQAGWRMREPHSARVPGLTPPACSKSQWSRVNHLGNGIGGHANGWNMTAPSHIADRCAFRVRYNITTMDYGAGMDPFDSSQINSRLNKQPGNNPAKVNIGAAYDLITTRADMAWENSRGFLWRGNPRVTIFDFAQMVRYCPNGVAENRQPDQLGMPTRCQTGTRMYTAGSAFCPMGTVAVDVQVGTDGATLANPCGNGDGLFCRLGNGSIVSGYGCTTFNNNNPSRGLDNNGLRNQGTATNGDRDFRLQLAINTNQFGRTFQDRTHSHAFRAVEESTRQSCRRIHALNVRGKRGNIVQTFPGTEYDFVPNILEVARGDCIHFQWTGSNTNPNNNDGQGKQGTDRSNIVLLENVRGEGARGVLRYGGAGLAGTTWTTENMEPGYQGYRPNSYPTMFDVQCNSDENPDRITRPMNTPYPAWRFCTNCNASSFRGTLTPNSASCPTGYAYQDCRRCGGSCCAGSGGICHRTADACTFSDRPSNPSVYSGVGVDSRDPGFTGFGSQQVGVLEANKFGSWGTSHPEHIDNATRWNVWGMSRENWINLATLKNVQFRGEMSELDDAGTYYDLPPQRISGPTGSMYYLCTRNNNFSNRSQKGKVVVSDSVEESVPCASTGCSVSASASPLLADAGLQSAALDLPAAENSGTVSVPPMAIPTSGRADVAVKLVPGTGLTDGSSDVMVVAPGNLASTPSFMQFQLMSTAGGRRRQTSESGIWVNVAQEVVGSNEIELEIMSPDSGIIAASRRTIWDWLQSRGQTAWEPWMCITFGFGGQTWTIPLGIPASNILQYQVTIPESERAAFNDALWKGTLMIMAGFPSEDNVLSAATPEQRSCSATPFTGTVPINPESGRPITITIPVAAAFSYGEIYRWPINNRTTACFVNKIGCDSVYTDDSRETISDASCSGGRCTMERSSSAGGYYQVSSSNTVALIVGITFGVLIFSALMVGSALYFRRNPEKWQALKDWGPNKYKSLERSLQSRV